MYISARFFLRDNPCAVWYTLGIGRRYKAIDHNKEFDDILRRKISETLGEPVDEGKNAEDLMFDLGMRY